MTVVEVDLLPLQSCNPAYLRPRRNLVGDLLSFTRARWGCEGTLPLRFKYKGFIGEALRRVLVCRVRGDSEASARIERVFGVHFVGRSAWRYQCRDEVHKGSLKGFRPTGAIVK
jgi:hypothetical protein